MVAAIWILFRVRPYIPFLPIRNVSSDCIRNNHNSYLLPLYESMFNALQSLLPWRRRQHVFWKVGSFNILTHCLIQCRYFILAYCYYLLSGQWEAQRMKNGKVKTFKSYCLEKQKRDGKRKRMMEMKGEEVERLEDWDTKKIISLYKAVNYKVIIKQEILSVDIYNNVALINLMCGRSSIK